MYINLNILYNITLYLNIGLKKNGSWGRFKTAEICRTFCEICTKETDCICTDSSDGEYGDISLCLNCVKTLFVLSKIKLNKT